jgi:hypothetical protein
MRLSRLRSLAEGRDALLCAKPDWECQKPAALNERNAAGQRRSDHARQRFALYQAVDEASRKIVTSACLGRHDRKQDLIHGAGPVWRDETADLGSEVNDYNAGLRGRCR